MEENILFWEVLFVLKHKNTVWKLFKIKNEV